MPRKAEFKPPVIPLTQAHARAMEMIDGYDDGCAIFMVDGKVQATRRTSEFFENNMKRLAPGLVGVYDLGADSRHVLEDLREFYKEVV